MVLAFMRQGATVITPNNRLSRELLTDFFTTSPGNIHEKPPCLPYQGFLHQLFQQHCNNNPDQHHPILLAAHQLRYVWQQVIHQSNPEACSPALIDELQRAWERCQRWQLDSNHSAFASTAQSCQFQQWVNQLQDLLTQLNLITDCQLVNFLIEQCVVITPTTLVWHAFNDYTPEQRVLHDYLANQGCELIHTDVQCSATSEVACYPAKDTNDEYLQLIAWLQQQLASGAQRIGVVVPNLQHEIPNLQRLLQQHLDSRDVNISLGKPLTDYSLVTHGLCWLGLNGKTLSNHQLRLLFYSPYLGHSRTEMLARMQSIQDCVCLQEHTIEQSVLITELAKTTPKLAHILRQLGQFPANASPQEWVNLFTARLIQIGFPGDMPLSSSSYQCLQRFFALFAEFKQFHVVTDTMSQADALASLQTLAQHVIFQPEKAAAKINVLGELEASGAVFDRLWITGLTDESFPLKARLSAFIPICLQREHSMPHANPTRELLLASRMIERFKNSSPVCIVSYPINSKDKVNLPSALIRDLPLFTPEALISTTHVTELEQYNDHYELPLALQEKIIGGTALLANQAKCPFRAFAAHRLHAKKALSISDGLTVQERGQVIHHVMEILWQALQTQATLLALSTSELDQLIKQAIAKALQPYQRLRQHSFPTIIQAIETRRLQQLVDLSLDWDKQRPAFTIEALEQAFSVELAGLEFNVRLDRLDKLASGKKWVIDYKSTVPNTMPWKQDRPKEPQLVLYALLDETINTLIFSGLKEGQLTNKGLSEDTSEFGISPIKKDENWDDYRQQWQQQLQDLAHEYHQGQCLPKPMSLATCQQCDYQSLCRYTIE